MDDGGQHTLIENCLKLATILSSADRLQFTDIVVKLSIQLLHHIVVLLFNSIFNGDDDV